MFPNQGFAALFFNLAPLHCISLHHAISENFDWAHLEAATPNILTSIGDDYSKIYTSKFSMYPLLCHAWVSLFELDRANTYQASTQSASISTYNVQSIHRVCYRDKTFSQRYIFGFDLLNEAEKSWWLLFEERHIWFHWSGDLCRQRFAYSGHDCLGQILGLRHQVCWLWISEGWILYWIGDLSRAAFMAGKVSTL